MWASVCMCVLVWSVFVAGWVSFFSLLSLSLLWFCACVCFLLFGCCLFGVCYLFVCVAIGCVVVGACGVVCVTVWLCGCVYDCLVVCLFVCAVGVHCVLL